MDQFKKPDPHQIARCVRGCATDDQYTELTDNIASAIRDAEARGRRWAADVARDYGRQVPAGRMFAERIAVAIAKATGEA